MRFARATLTALALSATVSFASAQPIATVEDVSSDLQISCALTAAGGALDIGQCLGAVGRGIDVAAAYDNVPQIPPQVDIGFLLCATMVARPALAGQIIALINASDNRNLAVGCSNALGPDWTGPRPIVSPA
jgi:hypothetical protein